MSLWNTFKLFAVAGCVAFALTGCVLEVMRALRIKALNQKR